MMNFKVMSATQKDEMVELLFTPLHSPDDVKDWIKAFLDLEYPKEITDPDSNSSPLDAIWQVYHAFQTNSGNKSPGFILMSCREGMKTISVSILELLLMLHFKLEIAHAAAIETQSQVAIRYITDFMFKIEPLIKHAGWEKLTENKRTIQFKTPDNKNPFIKILICNSKGMNSLHANVIFLDELDLADPTALKEARNIVGYSRGIYGITVYLSTRKYAFGNMQDALDKADEMKYQVLQWNLLDVTERCPPERHKPEGLKQDIYVAKNLPLIQLTPPQYEAMADVEKIKYDLVSQVHAGCVGCKLLPVCKTRLANKSPEAVGGFYKPIDAIIQKFRENDPDTAEAQLMCWKPGSLGKVYPRFTTAVDRGNVISLNKAFEVLTGEAPKSPVDETVILHVLKNLQCEIHCGVDWGFTHDAVIVLVAKIPNGEYWVIDCWSSPGMEFGDVLDVALKLRDKYQPLKWWCDTNQPANVKSFNRNGLNSPKFTKDVPGGIEAMRAKIINPLGQRYFKVLQTENNKKVISAITKHRFLLDGQGNPSPKPDDDAGIADICDSLRYVAQNLFPVKGAQRPYITSAKTGTQYDLPPEQRYSPEQNAVMAKELEKATGKAAISGGSTKRGGFRFTW